MSQFLQGAQALPDELLGLFPSCSAPFQQIPLCARPSVCPQSRPLWHSPAGRALTCLSLPRLHCPAFGLQARAPSVCQQTAAGTAGGRRDRGREGGRCCASMVSSLSLNPLPSPVPWHGGSQLCVLLPGTREPQGVCPLSFTTPWSLSVSPPSFTMPQSHLSSLSLCPHPPVTPALPSGLLPRGRGRWQWPDRASPGG